MSTPCLSVSAEESPISHLVAVSPALLGTWPDDLPAATLCGRAVVDELEAHPSRVQCPRCLDRVPTFMAMPSFAVAL